ncbi:hypothetical protein TBLA_0B04360 [Henningerozyma blattae CBS 6284]|uniref:Translocation protein SEC66 n=1 Tax=Henningerozyma blattae (strain ATCC 34711 / CBS 6284 / DSM 70876 / NBRC 10599 / NRRL Y-10934 / UCD 77-7) TaxID=1071380 RepID=I2GYS1_HENB6|nr:hypothetical protein TBLA_0B04360 [Tetrapisispora blattae CBS 6284]CCH59273.1 hypothetical protein TBLA_0B04360 [Tetrapisispora blattae CBS 6284]
MSFENNNTFTEANNAFNGTFNETFNNDNYSNTNGTAFDDTKLEDSIMAVSVYTPLIYVGILLISLMVFGSQYRKNQVKKLAKLKSIFDEQEAKDLYFELKTLNESGETKIHDKVLKAALLNRGSEAIRRSLKLKELAPQVEINYKTGSVGEDYWQRYQNEVKLIELEFKETLQEAELLQPGWSQMFVVVAKEICFNQALARRYQSILKRKEVAIEKWDLKLDNDGKLIEN